MSISPPLLLLMCSPSGVLACVDDSMSFVEKVSVNSSSRCVLKILPCNKMYDMSLFKCKLPLSFYDLEHPTSCIDHLHHEETYASTLCCTNFRPDLERMQPQLCEQAFQAHTHKGDCSSSSCRSCSWCATEPPLGFPRVSGPSQR